MPDRAVWRNLLPFKPMRGKVSQDHVHYRCEESENIKE